MAHPASAPADGPEPRTAPGDPGWCDYRKAVIAEAREARLVIELMAAYPADPRVLQLAVIILESLQGHADIGRRWEFEEKRIHALVEERVDEELARYGIRRHLRAVSDG